MSPKMTLGAPRDPAGEERRTAKKHVLVATPHCFVPMLLFLRRLLHRVVVNLLLRRILLLSIWLRRVHHEAVLPDFLVWIRSLHVAQLAAPVHVEALDRRLRVRLG